MKLDLVFCESRDDVTFYTISNKEYVVVLLAGGYSCGEVQDKHVNIFASNIETRRKAEKIVYKKAE